MILSDQHVQSAAPAPKAVLWAFTRACLVLSAILVGACLLVFATAYVPLGAFAAACVLVGYHLLRSYPHDQLGACNLVTLARLGLVAFLLGAVLDPAVSAWLVFAVAALAFSLDGLDGWLARRSALSSAFGARFDMETDAALAAVLALWLTASGVTGLEVLVLGFTRYAFVAAGWALPRLARALPPSWRRKAICVVQISALLVLVFPLTPPAVASVLSLSAALLLLWSFTIDIWWLLWRQK